MSQVNPDDDTLHRYVVWHYKYDPEFRERRMTAIAAFDTFSEADKLFKKMHTELSTLKTSGQADPRERISLDTRYPGHHARAVEARLAMRKMKSGWTAQGLTKKQMSGKPDWQSPS